MTIDHPRLNDSERLRYRAAVLRHFSFLKRTASREELAARTIPMPGGIGALQVICDFHREDWGVINDLAAWRDAHQRVFPTRFTVTAAGTQRWLHSVVLDVEDRILFLVLDADGRRIGHIGLTRCLNDSGVLELSNAVRGIKGVGPGLMRMAFVTIMEWGRVKMAPAWFDMRPFAHNTHAVDLYRQLGFRYIGEMPLRLHRTAEREDYLPRAADDSAPADATHLFLLRHPDDPAGHAPSDYVLPETLPS